LVGRIAVSGDCAFAQNTLDVTLSAGSSVVTDGKFFGFFNSSNL